jgi:mannose-6-phosphate isomerase-like protein (cupin superfamily)
MKYVSKNQVVAYKNSDACTAYEYPFEDKDINGAVIVLSGRYPDAGRVVNNVCKELVYIIQGSGRVVVESGERPLHTGDMLLIQPDEKYYFEGELEMLMPCTPAWYPEQHKEVE